MDKDSIQGLLLLAAVLGVALLCLILLYPYVTWSILRSLVLLLVFPFAILKKLGTAYKSAWFFLRRHVYSSPSNAAFFFYYWPRFYKFLTKMPFPSSIRKKRRLLQRRRHYLLFVWFFFSFFFRSFFTATFFLLRDLPLELLKFLKPRFAISFHHIFLYAVVSYYCHLLAAYGMSLSRIFFFKSYLSFRRFFYYLSLDEAVASFHTVFEEKNRRAKERVSSFDPSIFSWLLRKATPLTIPGLNSRVIKFFSKASLLGSPVHPKKRVNLSLLWLTSILSLVFQSFFLGFTVVLRTCFRLFGLAEFASLYGKMLYIYDTFFFFSYKDRKKSQKIKNSFPKLLFRAKRSYTFTSFFSSGLVSLFAFLMYSSIWSLVLLIVKLPMWILQLLSFLWGFILRKMPLLLLLVFLAFWGEEVLLLMYLGSQMLFSSWVTSWLTGWPPLWVDVLSIKDHKDVFIHQLDLFFSLNFRSFWCIQYAEFERILTQLIIYNFIAPTYTMDYRRWNILLRYLEDRFDRRPGSLSPWKHNRRCNVFYGEALAFFCTKKAQRGSLGIANLYKLTFSEVSKPLVFQKNIDWPQEPVFIANTIWFYSITNQLLRGSFYILECPYLVLGLIRNSVSVFLGSFYRAFSLQVIAAIYRYYYDIILEQILPWALSLPIFQWFLESLSRFEHNLYFAFFFLFKEFERFWFQSLEPGRVSSYYLYSLWKRQFHNAKDEFYEFLIFQPGYLYIPMVFLENVWNFVGAWELQLKTINSFSPLHLYLCLSSFAEKVIDTSFIYWQFPQMIQGSYNLWGYHEPQGYGLSHRKFEAGHRRIMAQSIVARQGLLCTLPWAPGFTSLFQCYFSPRDPMIEAYGAEIRPGFPRWKRVLPLLRRRKYHRTLLRLLYKPVFYAPLARHLGYFSYDPKNCMEYNLFHNPFVGSLYRPFYISLLGPFLYFILLIALVFFSYSFRKLFFPLLIEGGYQQYWINFLEDKHLPLVNQLVLPAESLKVLDKENSYSVWKEVDKETLEDFFWESVYNGPLRSSALKQTLSNFWYLFPSFPHTEDEALNRRISAACRGWERKLGSLSTLSKMQLAELNAVYYFYDLKFLRAFRNMSKVFVVFPNRIQDFMDHVSLFNDFNLQAAVELFSNEVGEEENEIRPEHLYRRESFLQRRYLMDSIISFFQYLDRRFCKNLLGGAFFHKDSSMGLWYNLPASLMTQEALQDLHLTPIFFSKLVYNQDHLSSSTEWPKIYPIYLFWWILLPTFLFAQGLISFFRLRSSYSPKTARYSSAEYALLVVELLLHFQPLYDIYRFFWPVSAQYLQDSRSGERLVQEEPQRWALTLSREEFFSWSLRVGLRYSQAESFFLRKLWPLPGSYYWKALASSNLGELRFSFFLWTTFQIFFLITFALAFHKPSVFWVGGKGSLTLATLSQQLHFKKVKLQLKKGLIWLWLKS